MIWIYDEAGGTSAARAQGEAISTVVFEDMVHILQERASGWGDRICGGAGGGKDHPGLHSGPTLTLLRTVIYRMLLPPSPDGGTEAKSINCRLRGRKSRSGVSPLGRQVAS